jgi:hypothetical protein
MVAVIPWSISKQRRAPELSDVSCMSGSCALGIIPFENIV